ncbi:hypothetical protein ACP70R_031330 [Stipagrostis hirtigluma subsp. patula]
MASHSLSNPSSGSHEVSSFDSERTWSYEEGVTDVPSMDDTAISSKMDPPVNLIHAQDPSVEDPLMKREVPLPSWFMNNELYKVQDWKAFIKLRKGVKKQYDRFYCHREYRRQFRSQPEVELFAKALAEGSNVFDGRKLHKKRTMDSDAQSSGANKTPRSSKATSTRGRGRRPLTTGNRSMTPEKLPSGFI